MATVSEGPVRSNTSSSSSSLTLSADISYLPDTEQPTKDVLATVYNFPNLEPLRFTYYSPKALNLPLRRDILHRAVVYEGDNTRQGTASTKWRSEVHGSHRKLYQQKGTGKARVGDKQSPIRRGGGVAFGPKPRDFATKLPKKMYDLAWRTALSYRYRRGQLILVDRIKNLTTPARWWIEDVFAKNEWGRADGRSFLIPTAKRGDNSQLFAGMEKAGSEGVIQEVKDVDVKDLLSMQRVIIEVDALDKIIREHSSDIARPGSRFSNQDPVFAEPFLLEEDIPEEDVVSAPSKP